MLKTINTTIGKSSTIYSDNTKSFQAAAKLVKADYQK